MDRSVAMPSISPRLPFINVPLVIVSLPAIFATPIGGCLHQHDGSKAPWMKLRGRGRNPYRATVTGPLIRATSSSGCLTEHQNRIETPEGKGVGHGVLHLFGAPDVGDIVEIALRVRFGQADRRGDEIFLDRFHTGNCLDAAASTQEVAVHRFRRRDGKLV